MLYDCTKHRDVQVQHQVNLALLQQFFSESQLHDISGDTLLHDPLKVMLPPFKIFQAEFSHEVKEDKCAKFDLEQISNLTKEDKQAFASRVLCDKAKQCTVDILITHKRAITLVF